MAIESQNRMWRLNFARATIGSVVLLALGYCVSSNEASLSPRPAHRAQLHQAYGKLPLSFEANRGQAEIPSDFIVRGPGYQLFLTATEAVMQLHNSAADLLRIKLAGAQAQTQGESLNELPGKVNYYSGGNPQTWRTNIATYARVRYQNVYPGITLVYYGKQQQLEHDFVIAPGADPKAIRLAFQGARELRIEAQGDLALLIGRDEILLHKPFVYQEVNGVAREIAGSYMRTGEYEVGFSLDDYDVAKPLIIDPELSYSTYFGTEGNDSVADVSVDSSGSAYVIGQTPVTNSQVFVAKLNPAGSALVYRTYLDGDNFDIAGGIAVDSKGNAYVTGYTFSTPSLEKKGFPVKNALQPFPGSAVSQRPDAFITKLNRDGEIEYSTYLGGVLDDIGSSIAVDAAGNAYVTGGTNSINFPTVNPLQPAILGHLFNGNEAFVAKLNAAGTALVYSTYLGGSRNDQGNNIAVDSAGNAYVTGNTASTDFPTTPGAFQTTFGGQLLSFSISCGMPVQPDPAFGDAFVVKLNTDGSRLSYATYLGGNRIDKGNGIALDALGNVYVTGSTTSTDFPVVNALQNTLASLAGPDAFVVKLNAMDGKAVFSTYLGRSGGDEGADIAVDFDAKIYVTGSTCSPDFFPTPGALQPRFAGGFGRDAFVVKLNNAATEVVYATYLGGSSDDYGRAIAVDQARDVYLSGDTRSPDFKRDPASPLEKIGGYDGFISKISFLPSQQRLLTPRPKLQRGSSRP